MIVRIIYLHYLQELINVAAILKSFLTSHHFTDSHARAIQYKTLYGVAIS